jgi:hypothetical protein
MGAMSDSPLLDVRGSHVGYRRLVNAPGIVGMYVGIVAVPLAFLPFLVNIVAALPGTLAVVLGVSGIVTARRDRRYPSRAAIAAVILGSLPVVVGFGTLAVYLLAFVVSSFA